MINSFIGLMMNAPLTFLFLCINDISMILINWEIRIIDNIFILIKINSEFNLLFNRTFYQNFEKGQPDFNCPKTKFISNIEMLTFTFHQLTFYQNIDTFWNVYSKSIAQKITDISIYHLNRWQSYSQVYIKDISRG